MKISNFQMKNLGNKLQINLKEIYILKKEKNISKTFEIFKTDFSWNPKYESIFRGHPSGFTVLFLSNVFK